MTQMEIDSDEYESELLDDLQRMDKSKVLARALNAIDNYRRKSAVKFLKSGALTDSTRGILIQQQLMKLTGKKKLDMAKIFKRDPILSMSAFQWYVANMDSGESKVEEKEWTELISQVKRALSDGNPLLPRILLQLLAKDIPDKVLEKMPRNLHPAAQALSVILDYSFLFEHLLPLYNDEDDVITPTP